MLSRVSNLFIEKGANFYIKHGALGNVSNLCIKLGGPTNICLAAYPTYILNRVSNPTMATNNVEDYGHSTHLLGATTLRYKLLLGSTTLWYKLLLGATTLRYLLLLGSSNFSFLHTSTWFYYPQLSMYRVFIKYCVFP